MNEAAAGVVMVTLVARCGATSARVPLSRCAAESSVLARMLSGGWLEARTFKVALGGMSGAVLSRVARWLVEGSLPEEDLLALAAPLLAVADYLDAPALELAASRAAAAWLDEGEDDERALAALAAIPARVLRNVLLQTGPLGLLRAEALPLPLLQPLHVPETEAEAEAGGELSGAILSRAELAHALAEAWARHAPGSRALAAEAMLRRAAARAPAASLAAHAALAPTVARLGAEVRRLALRHRELVGEGGEALAAVLRGCPNASQLDLAGNGLKAGGLMAVLKVLLLPDKDPPAPISICTSFTSSLSTGASPTRPRRPASPSPKHGGKRPGLGVAQRPATRACPSVSASSCASSSASICTSTCTSPRLACAAHSPRLLDLDISNTGLSRYGVETLVSFLTAPAGAAERKGGAGGARASLLAQRIRVLSLRDNPIGDVGLQSLADALNAARVRIGRLDLSRNAIGADGLACLACAVETRRFFLTRLVLGHVGCDVNAVLRALFVPQAPRTSPRFASVKGGGAPFASAQAQAKAPAPGDDGDEEQQRSGSEPDFSLRELVLSGNHAVVAGLVLAEALGGRRARGLELLDLSGNALDGAAFEALAGALPGLPRLRALSVARTGMSASAARRLGGALAEGCAKLARLECSHNGLPSAGTAVFATLLASHPCLAVLDVSGNEADVLVAGAFGAALSRGAGRVRALTMQAAGWRGSRLRAQGCAALCMGVLASIGCGLAELNLSGQGVGSRGAAMLASALTDGALPGLRALSLRDNNIEDEAAAALVAALQLVALQRASRSVSAGPDTREGADVEAEAEAGAGADEDAHAHAHAHAHAAPFLDLSANPVSEAKLRRQASASRAGLQLLLSSTCAS